MLKQHHILFVVAFIFYFLSAGWVAASDPSLVGHWTFDEGTGTTAVDASGNGFDGTYMNAEWGEGFSGAGSALAAGYVQVPASSWASIDEQVSVACWVFGNPDILLEKNSILCYASDDPGGSGGYLFDPRFMINKIRYTTGETMANPRGWDRTQMKDVPADIFAGQWRHWVFTKDTRSGEQNVYLDGKLFDAGGGLRSLAGVQYFSISHPQYPFQGRIDDFRLYNRALSLAEINALLPRQLTAFDPIPADGSKDVDSFANTLSWSPGETANQHKVYINTDPNLGPEQLYATTTEATVTYEEFFGLDIASFDFGVTYYWRVDEVEADGTTIHEGPLWSFTTGAIKATIPNPVDTSDAVSQPTLSWKPSVYAFEHTLYVSEDRDTVVAGNEAAKVGVLPKDTTDFTFGVDSAANGMPGVLEQGKTYYWRVDERDDLELVVGDVWSFTVITETASIEDPALLGWWKMDAEYGRLVVDDSGYGRHGQIEGDGYSWNTGFDGNALTLNTGGVVVDAQAVAYPNPVSTTAWIKKRSQGTAIANFGGFDFRTNFGRPAYSNMVRGAPGYDVSDNEWHHVACVAPENATFGTVVLYKDGIVVPHNDDYGNDPLGFSGEGPLYIGSSGNAPGSSNNGPIDGEIDDVRLYAKALTAEEIAAIMRVNSDLAWAPSPAQNASF
ncbi:LamG domain-containing protein, partial [Planctomycetota bacterium]